jgi:hypothetical protein
VVHNARTLNIARCENHNQTVTAVARELRCFMWAITVDAEAQRS